MPADSFNAFWRSRSTRERTYLGLGAAVLLLALVYILLLDPLLETRSKLEKRLPQLRAEVRLMQVQVAEVERLRAGSQNAKQGALLGRIGVSASEVGIRDKMQQIVSIAEDRVRVTGGAVPLNAWLEWLGTLEKQGIRVAYCRMIPTEAGGHAVEALLQGEPR
ncbi:MAG: type II secretion system protein M [Hydrogenophilales bacterium]|nr:type II secretion system protein M [Hydrogenophilales bacterium]